VKMAASTAAQASAAPVPTSRKDGALIAVIADEVRMGTPAGSIASQLRSLASRQL
jgi:hypothetical protein